MKFELGQVVNSIRDAHPVAAQVDGSWTKVERTVPRGAAGTIVGLKNESEGQPAGILVRFGGPEEEINLMRPEDLSTAFSPMHARVAQMYGNAPWFKQYEDKLPYIWHVISVLKHLRFTLDKEHLLQYLQLHDNAYVLMAAKSIPDQVLTQMIAEVPDIGADGEVPWWLANRMTSDEEPLTENDPRFPTKEKPPPNDDDDFWEEDWLRLMHGGLRLGSVLKVATPPPPVAPLAEFVYWLQQAGFYTGSFDKLRQMASNSMHPGAQQLQKMTPEQYDQFLKSPELEQAEQGIEQWMIQNGPEPVKTAPPPEPDYGAPAQAPTMDVTEETPGLPEALPPPATEPPPSGSKGVSVQVNNNGSLTHGGQVVFVREPGKTKPSTTVKPGAEVYLKGKYNRGRAIVLGTDPGGNLVVDMIDGGGEVSVSPRDVELSMRGASISMMEFIAQMPPQPPVGLGGPEAPAGTVNDMMGQPVAPGDFIQPAPFSGDSTMPGSEGRVTDVKPGGDVLYQDDSGQERVKDPDEQFQVVKQGSV